MAVIRPTQKTGGNTWTGIVEASIVNFKDRTNETNEDGAHKFPWADVYLEVEFLPKGSKYSKSMQITGSFEHLDNGKINSDSRIVRQIYYLFDALGFMGGLTADGKWETETGDAIPCIDDFLNEKYSDEDNVKYLIYIYKEPDKKNPAKGWTRINNYVKSPINDFNRNDLESRIEFLKSKGYIKIFDESNITSTEPSPSIPGIDSL